MTDHPKDISQRLLQYRPTDEWGNPVHHTICDEAAREIERLRNAGLCSDCPRVGYPTDDTRCLPCPRRSSLTSEMTRRRPPTPETER